MNYRLNFYGIILSFINFAVVSFHSSPRSFLPDPNISPSCCLHLLYVSLACSPPAVYIHRFSLPHSHKHSCHLSLSHSLLCLSMGLLSPLICASTVSFHSAPAAHMHHFFTTPIGIHQASPQSLSFCFESCLPPPSHRAADFLAVLSSFISFCSVLYYSPHICMLLLLPLLLVLENAKLKQSAALPMHEVSPLSYSVVFLTQPFGVGGISDRNFLLFH